MTELELVAGAYAAAAKRVADTAQNLNGIAPTAYMQVLSCLVDEIRALTPADARQASQQVERMACGHLKADWVETEDVCACGFGLHQHRNFTGNPKAPSQCANFRKVTAIEGHCRTCAAIASAEARARLETAKLRDALEEIAHAPLGSHATKQVAIETLRDSQVAKSIVDEWREDETGRVYVHKDAILKAINATIWQLTFLLDHSYNVPKDWRKRMAARTPDKDKPNVT